MIRWCRIFEVEDFQVLSAVRQHITMRDYRKEPELLWRVETMHMRPEQLALGYVGENHETFESAQAELEALDEAEIKRILNLPGYL